MLLIGIIAIFASLGLLFKALGVFGKQESAAAARLRELTESEVVVAGSAKNLQETGRQGLGYRLTPRGIVDKAERNYMLAGRPEDSSVAKILLQKVIIGAIGLGLGIMIFSSKGGLLGTMMLVGAPLIGYFAPDILLHGKAVRRQEEIQYALPDLLDQITISIESGTSFENALSRSGQTGSGPLADEIVRTVQDISLGLPRREAYESLVARTDVEELRKFVRSVLQGEEFGVPVSDIVRDQANEMRIGRRLRAEGIANQIPVKMLLPLMGTILPVLFIIVIGPAVIGAISAFKGQ
ncbi:type II secretion system F family protein [Aeromicrobium sp. 636]|uniref:Type II secretion system F family protein n=1 Tax=Aeromicrobium senzhongii TaxID=2663859 RepID=A0A8I0K2V3_9ACTN|nr:MULTISPECIES: type II secretion system F family protein [Aeromicrobium]MBC9226360.1 type II secretion system F family protein [Aeromicrobium senzhongii]MCQ3998465.1 type II secretion system F family protein [Aeromicrobium sp. 636]